MVVWQLRLTFQANNLLHFVAIRQMASERQSDNLMSDMEVHMKKSYVTEFLNAEENCTHWQVTVSRTASLPVAKCGVTTTIHSQNGSPYSGHR